MARWADGVSSWANCSLPSWQGKGALCLWDRECQWGSLGLNCLKRTQPEKAMWEGTEEGEKKPKGSALGEETTFRGSQKACRILHGRADSRKLPQQKWLDVQVRSAKSISCMKRPLPHSFLPLLGPREPELRGVAVRGWVGKKWNWRVKGQPGSPRAHHCSLSTRPGLSSWNGQSFKLNVKLKFPFMLG